MARQRITSGSRYEPLFGFSRAVREGNHVFVAGTAPIAADGGVASPGDMQGQVRRCLEIIGEALAQAGASFEDVVRTRLFVTDIGRWEEAARAHAEVFAAIRPAATIVGVQALVDPAMLVEIEADAVIGSGA